MYLVDEAGNKVAEYVYDPGICRFINADSFASTGQGLVGNNMFAYCSNNPVLYSDSTGDLSLIKTLVETAVGGLVSAVSTFATTGSLKEAGASFVEGAVHGLVSSLCEPLGALVRIYNTVKTVAECRESGAGWGASLLAGGVTLATSYVYGMEGNLIVDTAVDLTFGLGMSMASAGVQTGVIRNAERNSHNSASKDQTVTKGVTQKTQTYTSKTWGGGHGMSRRAGCTVMLY